MKYEVIRDTREQQGWWFPESDRCLGTTVSKLDTGDYTIRGLESQFIIERKQNLKEFAGNLVQPRFERELERLAKFRDAFLLIDCTFVDIINFPYANGIPEDKIKKNKVSSKFIICQMERYQRKYGVNIILTRGKGQEIAQIIFEKVALHAE